MDIHKIKEIESRQKILAKCSGGLYKSQFTGQKEYVLPRLKGGWEPLEQQKIGQRLELKLSTDETIKGGDQVFQVQENINISFSEVQTLAGDFYGDKERIYESKYSQEELNKKFMKSYDNLFNNKDAEKGLKELLDLIDKQVEQQWDYDKVTDGRYSQLAFNGSDQFENIAREIYLTGHNLAIQQAQKEKSKENLMIAYQIEGFAQNYLSKLFSAGHIRNPRYHVEQFIIGIGFSKLPGNPLAKFYANNLSYMQHEEDGIMGIYFTNQNGDNWYGMGDNFYTHEDNVEHAKMIDIVLQKSLDEIYCAYNEDLKEGTQINKFLPQVDEQKSNVPLLHYKNDRLYVRNETMNEHCRDTTHVLDMFELSKAMLEISQTGFYDLKIFDFFIDLFSPISKATSGCCGSAPKRKKNRTQNMANWVTPRDRESYFDLEKQLDKFIADPLKILPKGIVFNKKNKDKKSKQQQENKQQEQQKKTDNGKQKIHPS